MQDFKKKVDRLPKLYIDPGRPGGDEWALSFFDNGALAHTVVGAPAELIVSQKEIIEKLTEREARLSEALMKVISKTYSHIEPHKDLLAIMHPRHTLDIKRRVDSKEDWFEGDWLSNLWDARKEAEATVSELGIETGGE